MGRLVVITFLPVYLQERLGYSPFGLGVYIALLHAMGTISQPILGYLSDRLGRKAVLFPSFMVLGILFALLTVVAPGIPLAFVVGAIGRFFIPCSMSLSWRRWTLPAPGFRPRHRAFLPC
jgi:predicted MFS family arabinose efflux permease